MDPRNILEQTSSAEKRKPFVPWWLSIPSALALITLFYGITLSIEVGQLQTKIDANPGRTMAIVLEDGRKTNLRAMLHATRMQKTMAYIGCIIFTGLTLALFLAVRKRERILGSFALDNDFKTVELQVIDDNFQD